VPSVTAYEPTAYWERLLSEDFNEAGVGYPRLARSVNLAMYRSIERSVARALDAAKAISAPERVLDIGSGTGIWIDFWSRRGAAQLTGVDLAAASVERLRSLWPAYDFLQADIGDADIGLPGGNDVVSAMSVLLHIVEDARFRQAFANLAAALRPGGMLVLTEPIVVHRWWGPPFGDGANSKARPLADYRDALREVGLELRVLRPATVLLANVVDTRMAITFRMLQLYWDLLMRGVGPRERLGRTAAAVLGPADLFATRMMRTGPSAKILIASRAS
jgi:SAM-dependent methyltransferase